MWMEVAQTVFVEDIFGDWMGIARCQTIYVQLSIISQ